jgi:hypothetical protein
MRLGTPQKAAIAVATAGLVVGGGMLGWRSTHDGAVAVKAISPSSPPTLSLPFDASTTSVAAPPESATTSRPTTVTTTSTTVPRQPNRPAEASPTSTIASVPPGTSAPRVQKEGSSPGPAPAATADRACATTDLTVTVTADKTSYPANEDVAITLRAVNHSSTPCRSFVASCPNKDQVDAADSGGVVVWNDLEAGGGACATGQQERDLDPGAPVEFVFVWQQYANRSCGQGQAYGCGDTVRRGAYTLGGRWTTSDGAATPTPVRISLA